MREAEAQRRILPQDGGLPDDSLLSSRASTGRRAAKSSSKKVTPLTPEERAAREKALTQEVRDLSLKMDILRPQVDAGDSEAAAEWLDAAFVLVNQFTNTRRFFPLDRYRLFRPNRTTSKDAVSSLADEASAMQSRLEASELDDGYGDQANLGRENIRVSVKDQVIFRNKTWTEWRDIIIDCGCIASRFGQSQRGIEAVKACMRANIFVQSAETLMPFLLTLIAIGLYTQNYGLVSESLREVANSYHLFTDPIRLFGVVLHGQLDSPVHFGHANIQKWIRRECLLIEAALRGESEVDKGRTKHIDSRDRPSRVADGQLEYQTNRTLHISQRNPHYLAMNGHILSNNRSYQAALGESQGDMHVASLTVIFIPRSLLPPSL